MRIPCLTNQGTKEPRNQGEMHGFRLLLNLKLGLTHGIEEEEG